MSTLLSNGLDLDIEDYAGDTAKRVAEIYGKTDCLKVIEEHLKKKNRGTLGPVSPFHGAGSSNPRERMKPTSGAVKFQDSPGPSRGQKIFSNPEIVKKSD